MKEKWSEIKANLREMLDSGIFRVWVAPLDGITDERGMVIYAPNNFMAEWLKRHLLHSLKEAASKALSKSADDIMVDIRTGHAKKNNDIPTPAADIVAKVVQTRQAQGELPMPVARSSSNELWRYTFEDFVTGSSNNLAVAAAQDMCHMGQVRTLFVNSGPGLGKTHLAHAAGRLLSQQRQAVKVAYLTADQFASKYVAAMRAKDLENFKQYLCSMDALLLEDVHFLQRKKAMQEMVLAVVKTLQGKGARVIFTSSFAPRQLQEIDNQLVSHFCSGILTAMDKPDEEMRREILQRKAKSYQVALPEAVCDFLSSRLSSDVRQLEACLKNMVFKAKLLNSGLNIDLARETIGQFACAENILDMDGIVRLVCESFGLTEDQLRSRSRKQEYVQGRNTVFYLARKHTEKSLEDIGHSLNRRHSTVLRSITQVEEEMAKQSRTGRQFARAVALIERKCGLKEE